GAKETNDPLGINLPRGPVTPRSLFRNRTVRQVIQNPFRTHAPAIRDDSDHVVPGFLAGHGVARGRPGGALDVEGIQGGPERAVHPQGATQAAGTGAAAGTGQPAPVDLVRFVRVHEYVTVTVLGLGFLDGDLLVPAVHAADRIGLHGEREVLRDAAL